MVKLYCMRRVQACMSEIMLITILKKRSKGILQRTCRTPKQTLGKKYEN
jgi:hypothetical protein